jgi:hypothetical protein
VIGPRLPDSFTHEDGSIICRACYLRADADRDGLAEDLATYPACALPRCEWCCHEIAANEDHDTGDCPNCIERARIDREEYLADARRDFDDDNRCWPIFEQENF